MKSIAQLAAESFARRYTQRETRCVTCGAPGLDPQLGPTGWTYRPEHLTYCPVGRVLRWPSSQTAPGFEFLPESDVEQLRRAIR